MRGWSSPRFLRLVALCLLALGGGGGGGCHRGSGAPTIASPPAVQMPVTGQAVPEMAAFDRIVPELMSKWAIPGGAVAVAKDGRLVFARGYGYADRDSRESVAPDALFRIASVSKPITAVAILTLVEEERLELDAKPFALRGTLTPPAGTTVDGRLLGITVRQILRHTGGWDRNESFDPMFRPAVAAAAVGAPAPASAETVIRYMLGQRLDFDPASRYAYSNFGYAVLGREIERVTGTTYEDFVKSRILAPMGITRMLAGRSLLASRAPGEVRYYDPAIAPSVFPPGGAVPWPYGGFHLEAMDSHGGWLASAIDLLRFVTAVDSFATRRDVLRPSTIALMTARPPPPLWEGSAYHYAMGWMVRPREGNWWHAGSLPGSASLVVRTGSGLAWAVLFNARAMLPGSRFEEEIDPAIWRAVREVTAWPEHDLFGRYR